MRIRKHLALCSIPPPPPLSDPLLRRSEAAPPPPPPPDQNQRWALLKKEYGDDHEAMNNDIRKIVNMCDGASSSLQDSCSNEDYKVVPLKKRKGIFERNPKEETWKMNCKTNKKCGEIDQNPVSEKEANKRKRGNVIMEGSRCSRVNGRGWRCCQPTLVGYSLCDHHLGKGRLRSMTSVRRQHPNDNESNSQLIVASKKRTKVGVVKARSMSSLLSQI